MCVRFIMKSKGNSLCFDYLLLMNVIFGIVFGHGFSATESVHKAKERATSSLWKSASRPDSAQILTTQSDFRHFLTLISMETPFPLERHEPNISKVHRSIERTITSPRSPSMKKRTKTFHDVDDPARLTESTSRPLSKVPVPMRSGASSTTDIPIVPAESATSIQIRQKKISHRTAEEYFSFLIKTKGGETLSSSQNPVSMVMDSYDISKTLKDIVPIENYSSSKTESSELLSRDFNQQSIQNFEASFLKSSFASDSDILIISQTFPTTPIQTEGLETFQLENNSAFSFSLSAIIDLTPSITSQTSVTSSVILSSEQLEIINSENIKYHETAYSDYNDNDSIDYEHGIPNAGTFQKRFGDHYVEYGNEDRLLTEDSEQIEVLARKDLDLHHDLRASVNANLRGSFQIPSVSSISAFNYRTEKLPKVGATRNSFKETTDGIENKKTSPAKQLPSFSSQSPRISSENVHLTSRTEEDFLVVVNPTARVSKEMIFTAEIPSPTLDAEDVSQIVSILTEGTPELVTEEPSSREISVFMRDSSNSLNMKNKTSRDDNPHLDDIISGIIHLLTGDVNVVRQPSKFQQVYPPIPRPIRPTTTRINNRGPPLLTGQSRTVVVFSQPPPPHIAVRPNPPILPPVRLRPSTTNINNFHSLAGVTHFINNRPSRLNNHNAPTPSFIRLHKPLLNPSEIDNYGSTSNDDSVSVSRNPPSLDKDTIRQIVRLTDVPLPGEFPINHGGSTVLISHPPKNTEKDPELNSSHDIFEELPNSDEESLASLAYDEYYEDIPESEELKEVESEELKEVESEELKELESEELKEVESAESKKMKAPNIVSKTFEVFRNPPTVDTKLILPIATIESHISPSYQSNQNPNAKYKHTKTPDLQLFNGGSSETKKETDVIPSIGSSMPPDPVIDWLPYFEHPSNRSEFDFSEDISGSRSKATTAQEVFIITQPTIFDLTVTNAIAGVQLVPPPGLSINTFGHNKSSSPSTNGIWATNDRLLPLTKLSKSQMANMYSLIISTVEEVNIHPTRHEETTEISSLDTSNGQHSVSFASPPEISVSTSVSQKPQIVYGRPHSIAEKSSPPRIDNLSKYRHDHSNTSFSTKTGASVPVAFDLQDGAVAVDKGSGEHKIIPPSPKSNSSNSSASTSANPTRPSNGGTLLGRPIVIPVDIEEVRPFVGAINPPRQGARPTSNRGNHPLPGFPGPPPSGVGNVQVAQAGVNVAEDSRNRSPGARPTHLLTSRPPLVRTQARPRPNSPLVRIDTCIVGDDSTCDLEMNETCKTEQGVSSCQCRPGFIRSFTRGPCQPVVSVMLSLKIDRFGDQRVSFNSKYQDSNSEEYRLMEFEAKQALSSLFSNTAFARNFMGVSINKFYSIGGRLIINATVHLEEKESTRAHSLRLQMRQEVVQAINNRNQNIGDSRLYVEGPLNPVPAVEDVNECAESDLNDCSENGFCLNIFGTYQCKCRLGYLDPYPDDERLSGRKCSACSVDYCSNHGQCFVENGQKMCKCRGNYIGSRCEIDGEVLGVALGATLAAVIIIILTLACLCIWNRRWKREQQKAEAMSARSVNSIQTYSYLNKMTNSNAYRLTMEDRMRWAHIADVMGSNYAQPDNGSTAMQNAVVPSNQSVYLGPSRCNSPSVDKASWYNYNTRPRSRAATSHTTTPMNNSYYDMDYSTRETYVGPGYVPSTRYMPPNIMRTYYS